MSRAFLLSNRKQVSEKEEDLNSPSFPISCAIDILYIFFSVFCHLSWMKKTTDEREREGRAGGCILCKRRTYKILNKSLLNVKRDGRSCRPAYGQPVTSIFSPSMSVAFHPLCPHSFRLVRRVVVLICLRAIFFFRSYSRLKRDHWSTCRDFSIVV